MKAISAAYPTLSEAIWRGSEKNQYLRLVLLAIGGSLLLTLSAKIQIPFYPVPMTMQPLVVVLIGAAFGWRLGAATIMLYLAQGAAGLPVFAGTPEKGIGLAYMMGPTGGYMLGFLFAASLAGYLAERGWDRSVFTTFAMMILAMLAIYAPGIAWLGTLIGWDKPVLELGLIPFLPGDMVKAALAAALLPIAWKWLR